MKTIDRKYHHSLHDSTLPPAERVGCGEPVVFETLDACYGKVRSLSDFHLFRDGPEFKNSNPLTGPVYIENARSGGGLIVNIISVELDKVGFQLIGPHRAVIRDEISDWDYYAVEIRENVLYLPRGMKLPIDPVIGSLGNAPAGKPTDCPNRLGGNLDCPLIRAGARVYLPIEVDGALFSLGDVHARQGDGEVVGAPEIGARVTVQFEVMNKPLANWPIIEDQDAWHVVTCGATEEDAIRLGVFESAHFLQSQHGITLNDALVLLTMCITLRCSRTGGWGDLDRVVCSSIPKRLIEQATAEYLKNS